MKIFTHTVTFTVILLIFNLIYVNNGQTHGSACNEDSECGEDNHLVCTDKSCQCESGYTVTREKQCRLTYGGQCGHILDCNIDRYLTCHNPGNDVCRCMKPEEQIFEQEKSKCVSLVGHYCDHESGEFNLVCVNGAFCDMPIVDGQMQHICTCNPGWNPTQDNRCEKSEPEKCESEKCESSDLIKPFFLLNILLLLLVSFIHQF